MDQYSSPKNIISNSSLPFSSHSPFYLFAHPAHALSSEQTFTICSDKGLTPKMSALNSLPQPIYIINLVDTTKLSCLRDSNCSRLVC